MNKLWIVFTVVLLSCAAAAQTAGTGNQNDPKPETNPSAGKEDPKVTAQRELQSVRTVFVKGNSESSNALRDKMDIYSCLQPAINEKKADAVMDVDESSRRSDSWLGGHSNKISASVTITMPNGDVVWSKNKVGDEGFVHSGAGGAAVAVLRSLAKDACPGWSLRNEGKPGTAFHKDYVRPTAAPGAAAPHP